MNVRNTLDDAVIYVLTSAGKGSLCWSSGIFLSGPGRGIEPEQIVWKAKGHSKSRTFASEMAEFDEQMKT